MPKFCEVIEIMWSNKFDSSTNARLALDTVRMCFSGNALLSRIFVEGIHFPVKPYIQPVMQCRKCWRFGYTDKVCAGQKSLCTFCGADYESSSLYPQIERCTNCKGDHDLIQRLKKMFFLEKNVKIEKGRCRSRLNVETAVSISNKSSLSPANNYRFCQYISLSSSAFWSCK